MPLREDLLTPIPGDNPSGKNLRYDPVTDAIKEARREDADVPQGEWKTAIKTADHAQVIKLASDVIAKRSKDLQIAVWLVDAHIRREGFAMLAPGFDFLRGLVDQFWGTLYPEIEDGDLELRTAPLEWLGTKLDQPLNLLPITSAGLSWSNYKESRTIGYEQDANNDEKRRVRQQAIADHKPTAEDFDEAFGATPRSFYENLQATLASALDSLQGLNELCDEKFGEYAPSFVKTRTAIENIAQQTRVFLSKKGPAPAAATPAPVAAPEPQAPPPAPAAVSAPPPPAAPPPAAVSTPAPVAAAVNQSSEPSGLADVIQRTGVVCRYLREKTIYDAAAYLVIRALRWSELRAKAPEIVPSMLEAPPSELRAEMKRLFLAGEWDELLNATERAMELPCGRAWLDLQRYTVMALENKDAYFAGVANAVRIALRGLLEELPGLLDQTLTDDTPVANPETRTWIDEHVMAGAQVPAIAPTQVAAIPLPVQTAPEPVAVISVVQVDLSQKPPELEPDEEDAARDVFEQALAAAQSSRPQEALEMIGRQLEAERSGRGRFRRRTQLAHLLMAGGHAQIAFPILEELAAEIDQRRLEDWERGDALAYPVELLIRCLDENGAESPERKKFYARLCRLDPVRALKWKS
ncbi:MAG: type VI secretion system protein TssA [Acidobacteriaceae bacterium]|nr:type VI secretion system protein TssA [Acidobacteriaceae bacterium]